jgi:hypothetical protein
LYGDRIVRYLTRLKGSPTRTVAWEPFAAGDPPKLHFAVAGDVGDSGARSLGAARKIVRNAFPVSPRIGCNCPAARRRVDAIGERRVHRLLDGAGDDVVVDGEARRRLTDAIDAADACSTRIGLQERSKLMRWLAATLGGSGVATGPRPAYHRDPRCFPAGTSSLTPGTR